MERVYLVFSSTHETLTAEQALAGHGIAARVVNRPAHIKLDCGLAIRLAPPDREPAVTALAARGIRPRGIFPC